MNLETSSLPERIGGDIIKAFRLAGVRLERVMGEPKLIVVIMDGSEDACAIALLLHRLDGKFLASLLRPERLGPDNIGKNLSTYIHRGFKQRAFLMVLDQEDIELEEMWGRVEGSLTDSGITYSIVGGDIRWRLYNCILGGKEFSVGVVVNGLDERYVKHSIEDHLVELAMLEGLVKESFTASDSKGRWLKISEDGDARRAVYRGILGSRHTPSVFKQHVSAVERLKEVLE